jgi:hypothetical protein
MDLVYIPFGAKAAVLALRLFDSHTAPLPLPPLISAISKIMPGDNLGTADRAQLPA